MKLSELNEKLNALQGFNNKVGYRQFPEEDTPELPYITYEVVSSSNFYADNISYALINNVSINLISQYKDIASEELIEDMLDDNCIGWSKSEDYLEAELTYQITYEIQI